MKIKRIALVETKGVRTHVFSRRYSPRLGLPILSAVLKKAGYEVELFFQELHSIDIDYLMKFDMVGFSALTTTVTESYRLGKILKSKGRMVVMGGPHVSASADEALDSCDYVVRGEGEISFLKLLETINEKKAVSGVPGVSYRADGQTVHNPSSLVMVDMETLPANDFSACKSYKSRDEYPGGIMFSRGCPYDCNFCSVTTTFGKKYRYKTTGQIIDELRPFAGRAVCFIDDNFAAHPKKTKLLLRAMIDEKVTPHRYSCQLRVNAAADEELLDLMERTNCRVANIGLESIDPITLKQYHKGQTLEQITDAIKTFKKFKIGLHGMFVLGADNDTVETIKNTVDFALDTGIDTIQMCALTPFPGTAIYDQMKREKRILHSNWELYDGLHVVIQPKNMSSYELQVGIIEGMERFYSVRHAFRIDLHKKWRFLSRLIGCYLVNRWKTENAAYLGELKAVA